MDLITTEDVRRLISRQEGPLVSIYAPMVRKGSETQQNPIRFKQGVSTAMEELEAGGVRRSDAEQMMEPAARLVDDHDFWQHQEDGLAVFVDDGDLHRYRLPVEFETLVTATDRYHVKPLLPIVDAGGEFYVLAISHDEVRLLRGSRYRVSEIELPDVPTSLAEALWYKDPEYALQHHTTAPAGAAAAFHGHGLDGDSSKEDLQAFFRAVDDGLGTIVGNERAPFVLAGVDYLLPLYREISSFEIVPEGIEGSPEMASVESLHERAWPLVAGVFDARRVEARDRLLSSGTESLDDITAIVPAAVNGRVEALFVTGDGHEWGTFDGESLETAVSGDGDVDLYDVAASATWQNGGDVFVMEAEDVPADGDIAALLRF